MAANSSYNKSLQWLSINDFSPGIFQYNRGGIGSMPNFKAPLGSAQSAFRCINEPGVGLMPMPKPQAARLTIPTAGLNQQAPMVVCGFYCNGPVSEGGIQSDELWINVQYTVLGGSTTSSNVFRIRYVPGVTTFTATIYLVVGVGNGFNGINFFNTRLLTTTPFTANYPFPVVGWFEPTTWNDGGFFNHLYTSPSIITFANDSDRAILAIGGLSIPPSYGYSHTGRIVFHTTLGVTLGSSPGSYQLSEDLVYYDPPGFALFANQTQNVTVFTPERFGGYGAFGSVSTGELLLIRQTQGAVLIYGDVAAPSSAVSLPGVVGTGAIIQKATPSPIGLIYCVENDGAYAWNGNNTSQKISENIPDNFHVRLNPVGTGLTISTFHCLWGDWLMFSGNWCYDSTQKSWWRIEDPGVTTYDMWAPSSAHSHIAYGTPASFALGATNQIAVFDKTLYAASYVWNSNPIPATLGQLVDVREVEIVVTNPASVTSTVALQFVSGDEVASQTLTFTVPANVTTYRLRDTLGLRGMNIQVNVTATCSDAAQPAPILHEINVGWIEDRTPPGQV